MALFALALAVTSARARALPELRVGSKRFTESYLLAEIAVEAARQGGDARVSHLQGLGGTAIVFRAIEAGQIDVYPEYTGTLAEAVLHQTRVEPAVLRQALASRGLGLSEPLGFSNTYAIAAREDDAERLGLTTLTDLAAHPELRLGLSHEFLGRDDGWPGLAARYDLHPRDLVGMDHGLSYRAIEGGSIDLMDVYSTDAQIASAKLRVLRDDAGYFPSYEAVYVYRLDLPTRAPSAWAKVAALAGSIRERDMIALNAEAEARGSGFDDVARAFLSGRRAREGSERGEGGRRSFLAGLGETIRVDGPRHLELSAISLLLALLVGLPLGVLASRSRLAGHAILTLTGLAQTIPSLALLCFFIPLLGTGVVPAIAALFLYSLLPIVRNTAAGLLDLAPALRESAEALGLPPLARLWRVELPMASRTILAGVKTSAVINVGTATLAAFIGAGGFGQPISTGLNLNDNALILQGALPAAALALGVQWAFDLLERIVVPRGLRVGEAEQR
jgi:osmoprotectant transport system permease protein